MWQWSTRQSDRSTSRFRVFSGGRPNLGNPLCFRVNLVGIGVRDHSEPTRHLRPYSFTAMAAASVDDARPPTRFWCYECDREVRSTVQGDGSFNCDVCASNFVEQMEADDPRGRPTVAPAPPAAAAPAPSSANMGWQYSSSHGGGGGGGGAMPFFQFQFGGAPGAHHHQHHAMPPHQAPQHQQVNMNPIAKYDIGRVGFFRFTVLGFCLAPIFPPVLSCIGS